MDTRSTNLYFPKDIIEKCGAFLSISLVIERTINPHIENNKTLFKEMIILLDIAVLVNLFKIMKKRPLKTDRANDTGINKITIPAILIIISDNGYNFNQSSK